MKQDVTMPRLNAKMQAGVLAHWCKEPGETVAAGETLCEIEADKVVTEVAAPCAGTVTALYGEEGDEVAVGAVIATVEDGR